MLSFIQGSIYEANMDIFKAFVCRCTLLHTNFIYFYAIYDILATISACQKYTQVVGTLRNQAVSVGMTHQISNIAIMGLNPARSISLFLDLIPANRSYCNDIT